MPYSRTGVGVNIQRSSSVNTRFTVPTVVSSTWCSDARRMPGARGALVPARVRRPDAIALLSRPATSGHAHPALATWAGGERGLGRRLGRMLAVMLGRMLDDH